MSYGLITSADASLLELCLRRIIWEFPDETISIVEIGVCHGDTARGIKGFMDGLNVPINYYGVDNGRDRQIDPPFHGATILLGDSSEIYMHLPQSIHFVLIDGCHCVNHAMLDFLHVGYNVKVRGMALFHDVAKRAQNKFDYQGHGPRSSPDFGTGVYAALLKLGLLRGERSDWDRFDWAEDESFDYGGMAAYRKIK
jgi:Methyltransferase domain